MTEEELREVERGLDEFVERWSPVTVQQLVTEVRELRRLLQAFVDWDQNAEHDPYLLRDCFVRAKEKLGDGTESAAR